MQQVTQSQSASRTELVMSTVVTITLYGEQAQEGVKCCVFKGKRFGEDFIFAK